MTGGTGARRVPVAALLALIAGLVLSGCTALTTAGGDAPGTVLVGAGTGIDERFGSEEHPRIIAAYGGVYHDEKLEQTLARIVGRVVAASDKPDQSYRITILNAPAVFRWTAVANPERHLEAARLLGAETRGATEDNAGEVLAGEIIRIMRRVEMPNGLAASAL